MPVTTSIEVKNDLQIKHWFTGNYFLLLVMDLAFNMMAI